MPSPSPSPPPDRTIRIDLDPTTLVDATSRSAAIPVRLSSSGGASGTCICRGPLRQGQQAYARLLDSLYDAVFITDASARIIDLNPRAIDFFLLSPENACGASVLELISGADEGLLRQIRGNLEEHRFTLLEATCVRSDKSTFPAEIAVNRVDITATGQLSFFVRDISVRRQALARLEDANERLRAHDRARMDFISNVSHELRTPLTSMIYGVRNLLRGVSGELGAEVRAAIQRLEGDCRRLLNTVNDILDLRMIEAGSLTLAKTLVPLSRLARGCVDALRIQADEKRQTLLFHASDAGSFLLCDIHKMERVLINVIGNAIKFTPEGGRIEVGVGRCERRTGYVQFVCDDTGVGIPSESLGLVAERYFRIGKQVSGSGLGLAISKEIIVLHGGLLEVLSPVPGSDRGTSVRVLLPAEPPPLVLVLELLSVQIEEAGYRVATAASAREAVEVATRQEVGLVVLDLLLPDLDGSQVILQLRGRRDQARVPILALSGAEPDGAPAEIIRRFHIPLLTKPWKTEDLLARIGTSFYSGAHGGA